MIGRRQRRKTRKWEREPGHEGCYAQHRRILPSKISLPIIEQVRGRAGMSVPGKIPVYTVYNAVRHPALALGMIVAFAKSYRGGLLNDAYEFIPGAITSQRIFHEKVRKHGAGIFLCSHYKWSSVHNLQITKIAKAFFPGSITIHGGPHVPKYEDACQEFFDTHPHVDIAVRGEGEMTAAELLEQIARHGFEGFHADHGYLAEVAGISFRSTHRAGGIVRTQDRVNIKELDSLPSPYLTGEFRADEVRMWHSAVIETNRGCPYGCAFCDWGSATLSKIRQFALARVEAELEWIARNGIGMLWVADANFGIFPRDVRIAETIAACRRQYGFPRQIVFNYAKNATDRLAEIVRILHAADIPVEGIIAIQTSDPATLAIADRSNIKTERYDELAGIFARHNLPLTSDLILGLPGSTLASFKADLQFLFDRKVWPRVYRATLLPNSPMAHRDYVKKYEIQTDASGNVISTYSFSAADLAAMKELYRFYKRMALSALKYLLLHLQVEYDIKAVDFIDTLHTELKMRPGLLPATERLAGRLRVELCNRESHEWESFYDEISGYIAARYGIIDPPVRTILTALAKIRPARDRRMPERLDLEYDLVGYFDGFNKAKNLEHLKAALPRRLAEYGPGVLEVSDPHGLCKLESGIPKYGGYRIAEWELASDLSQPWLVPERVQ